MVKKGENIYKRKDDRWEGRYIKGRTSSGKIRYGYVYGKKYNEVKLKLVLKKAEYQYENQTIIYDGQVGDWLHYWLEQIISKEVKPSTYASYYYKMTHYIMPDLGTVCFERLDSDLLRGWLKNLEEKGLAHSSIRTILQILKGSLNLAVRKGYLQGNPCEQLELPRLVGKKIRALSKKEQSILEQNGNESQGGLAILLSLYTGMRIGEISGLKWENIDFQEKIINVNQTLQRISTNNSGISKTKIVLMHPKTSSSHRKIPFSDNLLYYLLLEKKQSKSEYVVSIKNSFVEPRTINNQFKKIQKNSGLENLHFHMLRHTFVTRCLEENIDIASISTLLGHASAKMTLDIYADSFMEQRQLAMAKVDQLMRPITGKTHSNFLQELK